MDQLKITLELLYDLLRNEKKREDLQKLDPTFYVDLVGYLREKKEILDKVDKTEELFGQAEKDKLQGELRSIKRIVREIYEKREKKIIDIALNKSKTGSEIIDTTSMLIEEKVYYDQILLVLDSHRRGVMHALLRGEIPIVSNLIAPTPHDSFQNLSNPRETNISGLDQGMNPDLDERNVIVHKEMGEQHGVGYSSEVGKSKVKVVVPIPSFVWKDMKVYGPFDIGEEATLFTEVADLLVRKGRAIKV